MPTSCAATSWQWQCPAICCQFLPLIYEANGARFLGLGLCGGVGHVKDQVTLHMHEVNGICATPSIASLTSCAKHCACPAPSQPQNFSKLRGGKQSAGKILLWKLHWELDCGQQICHDKWPKKGTNTAWSSKFQALVWMVWLAYGPFQQLRCSQLFACPLLLSVWWHVFRRNWLLKELRGKVATPACMILLYNERAVPIISWNRDIILGFGKLGL